MIIEKYETSDLVLAAVLRLQLVEMTHIRMTGKNQSRGMFCFKDVEKEFIDQFIAGKILVEPGDFHQMTRKLTDHVRTLVNDLRLQTNV